MLLTFVNATQYVITVSQLKWYINLKSFFFSHWMSLRNQTFSLYGSSLLFKIHPKITYLPLSKFIIMKKGRKQPSYNIISSSWIINYVISLLPFLMHHTISNNPWCKDSKNEKSTLGKEITRFLLKKKNATKILKKSMRTFKNIEMKRRRKRKNSQKQG